MVEKFCQRCRSNKEEKHFCRVCGRCFRECRGLCERYGLARMQVRNGTYWVNTLRRSIGVEIEACYWGRDMIGVRRLEACPGVPCLVTRDGSVNGSETEVVVPPLRGDELVEGLTKVAQILTDCMVEMDVSCGYHVHVDGEDLTLWDIRRVMHGYLTCEEEIYRMCRAERRNNRHCTQMREQWWPVVNRMWAAQSTGEIKSCLVEMLYGVDLPETKAEQERLLGVVQQKVPGGYRGLRSWVRYTGLNMHSWMHRGTLEWRMKEGTVVPEAIVMWPLFCGWFVEVLGGMGDRETQEIAVLGDVVKRMPIGVREWVREALKGRQ